MLALVIALAIPAGSLAWAPAKSTTIHPGVQTFTECAQCTSNFVFQEGSVVYLGQAAHCSGTGGQTETDGCSSGSLPLGTPVEVKGASRPGTLVYNSWLTMQANGGDRPRHLRLQRPGADQDRPRRRRQRQPLGPWLRRANRHRHRRRSRLDRLLLRQLRAAWRHRQAQPQAGRHRPERRQRLEPCRGHPVPGRAG
jgi:hypothetical protein